MILGAYILDGQNPCDGRHPYVTISIQACVKLTLLRSTRLFGCSWHRYDLCTKGSESGLLPQGHTPERLSMRWTGILRVNHLFGSVLSTLKRSFWVSTKSHCIKHFDRFNRTESTIMKGPVYLRHLYPAAVQNLQRDPYHRDQLYQTCRGQDSRCF